MLDLACFRRFSFAIAAVVLSGLAFAQGETFRTGLIEAIIEGENHSAYTYATEIPDDVADGVTDEQQRAILERVAGTTQHSATFMHQDAMVLGGMVLVPERIYVTFSTRTDHPESDNIGSFVVMFSLDPESLELADEVDTEVTFYPLGVFEDTYYALTDGMLELTSLQVTGPKAMSITGVFSGHLSMQDDYDIVHNPDDTLQVEASFNIDQVVSSSLAFELVTGE